MAASKAINLTRQGRRAGQSLRGRRVKPLMSVDSSEAKGRVLSLYKAWWRYIPVMMREYRLPVTVEGARAVLRAKFEENAHVKDIRVIDMLVVKGQQDLQETVEHWSEVEHIMNKFFSAKEVEKPKDFMSKFLAGQD